jgi:DNA-binding NarL/FixJ family response regulator
MSAAPTPATRLLIVDDHKLFAKAIRLSFEPLGFEVTVAGSRRDALERFRSARPHLVLMDLALPDGDGVDLGRAMLSERGDAKLVALTALSDARAVRAALRAGFHGYLTKDMPIRQFVSSVRAALEGQVVIPRHLSSGAAGARTPREEEVALLAQQLTPREREVLAMLAEGARGEDIAERLTLSPNTVRTHIANILTKLQARSRLEAATFALRHGLVEAPDTSPFG